MRRMLANHAATGLAVLSTILVVAPDAATAEKLRERLLAYVHHE